MIAKQYTIYNNSSVSRDSYGSRSTTNNCKVMWARMVVGVSVLHPELTFIMQNWCNNKLASTNRKLIHICKSSEMEAKILRQ